ncbi:hypothetical protein BDK88_3450 [Natrinema hispanicum]|uniref:Uncharacterized protein n=1 Tax=Natrinema hispanicum TaxID=392421 RepID=A0A482Y629_9EURY|nr:hypothetical protein BDK88_3450 [Natrinema hispanicum]
MLIYTTVDKSYEYKFTLPGAVQEWGCMATEIHSDQRRYSEVLTRKTVYWGNRTTREAMN